MARPDVKIALMTGQLNIAPPSSFGTTLLMVATPLAPAAGYGVAFKVKSKADVNTAFAGVGMKPVIDAINLGFFGEAPEGNTLWVVAMAQATTLTTLIAAINAEKALIPAKGEIRHVAVCKFPAGGYVPIVTNGFDADVHTAVTAAQTLANAWTVKKKPFRVVIQGYACDGIPGGAYDYAVTTNRNVLIVGGEIDGSSAMATLMAVGRKVKGNPQQNIGRVLGGSLNIDPTKAVTVGGLNVSTVSDTVLDGYYDKRYITLEPNKASSGYIFTDDVNLTAPTDDYNDWAKCAVMDNMIRVADRVYYRQVKNDVDVDENGRIDAVIERALQDSIIDAITDELGGQLSRKKDGTAAVECYVNPDPVAFASLYSANNINTPNLNLLETGQLYIFITGRPKGCLRNISIYIGYSL